MVNVAIAGGSSPTLGAPIVKAIMQTESHKPLILTWKDSGETSEHDVPFIETDYTKEA